MFIRYIDVEPMPPYTNQQIQQCINTLLNPASDNEKDEDWLCNIIQSRKYNLLPFHNAITDIIFRRISNKIDLLDLNQWKLLHCIFRHILLASIGIELRCTEIRRVILLEAINNLDCIKHLQSLVLSIAIQSYKNEHVYYCQPDEIDAVKQIQLQLEQAITNNTDLEEIICLLHLSLMYCSPLDLKSLSIIKLEKLQKTNSELVSFINEEKISSKKEIESSDKYLNTFSLTDGVSKKVASMYESNPYPRWTEPLTCMNPDQLPLEQFTGVANFPKYKAYLSSIDTMLIAGCGTGRHPIQVALNYPWIKITAIDISYRSIGYAAMMAEKAGATNIKFSVCDILDLNNVDKQYDMIDCIGVLHHLKHPEKGLQALLSKLRKGGLVRLGLYSKSAREAIIRFRENNKLDGRQINSSTIREIRHQILEKNDPQDRTILQLDDFYTLSGCRDLMLHEQETQYTIPELKNLLEHNNLTFLGLGMPHRLLASTIQQNFGANADIHDIDNWQKAESLSPFLFSSMYNFFTQIQN